MVIFIKLYVVRHGLTDLNMQGVYNGLLDEDINKIGIRQAKDLKEIIKKKEYDIIYCSPMLRTRHTCDIINDGKMVIYDKRIVERTLGELDGKKLEDVGFSKKSFFDYNYESSDKRFETLPILFYRVHGFLNDIIKKNWGKNILIITHGGVVRAIHFYFNKLPENGDLSKYIFKNCEINEYVIEERNYDK